MAKIDHYEVDEFGYLHPMYIVCFRADEYGNVFPVFSENPEFKM